MEGGSSLVNKNTCLFLKYVFTILKRGSRIKEEIILMQVGLLFCIIQSVFAE